MSIHSLFKEENGPIDKSLKRFYTTPPGTILRYEFASDASYFTWCMDLKSVKPKNFKALVKDSKGQLASVRFIDGTFVMKNGGALVIPHMLLRELFQRGKLDTSSWSESQKKILTDTYGDTMDDALVFKRMELHTGNHYRNKKVSIPAQGDGCVRS